MWHSISPQLSLTHLLFVDDVILFGTGTFEEWVSFKVILDNFCAASSMCINMGKSYFLFNNVEEGILNRISCSLYYKYDHISLGFRYLGYFIKPLGYLVKDWNWLVKNFEKRIQHWTHRFLSLGGRLVLIRVVLTSMPVYWLALVPIRKSILEKLKKLIFSFLWGSSVEKRKYHLVDWLSLSWPTSLRGWGIKHLGWFSLSLCLKSLWMVLKGTGIWHQILSTKYLKKHSVVSWIRQKYFFCKWSFSDLEWLSSYAHLGWKMSVMASG